MNNQYTEVLNEVIKRIRPTNDELLEAINLYEELRGYIEENLKIPYEFKVTLEGSLAKGTCIRGEIDLDIFILIKYRELSNEWIKKHVIKPLVRVLKEKGVTAELRYASHPYIRVIKDRFQADIVPAYWAETIDEIMTPVDRTPFHTKYVVSKLSSRQKDDVRLLKKFLKGVGIYGAEIKTKGFSGYLCELLIIKYGTFLDVLKNARKWRVGSVIIVDKVPYSLSEVNKMFPNAILRVPDPVDPRRNAAAAVSRRSLSIMSTASALFLKYPDITYFFPAKPHIGLNDLINYYKGQRRSVYIVLLKIINTETSPDIIWGKLSKLVNTIERKLTSADIEVIDLSIWSDDRMYAVIAIEVLKSELPHYELRRGPPTHMFEDVIRFYEKNFMRSGVIGPWIDRLGSIRVMIKRNCTDASKIVSNTISNLLKSSYSKYFTLLNIIDFNDLNKTPQEILKNESFHSWIAEVILRMPSWLPRSLTKFRSM